MPRSPLAAAPAALLLLAGGACAPAGSVSDAGRPLPVLVYATPPSCPFTTLGEVRSSDPPGFEHFSVTEQARRIGGDAVIDARFDPADGTTAGTAIRFTEPGCRS